MRRPKGLLALSILLSLKLVCQQPLLAQDHAGWSFPESRAEDVAMSSEKLRHVVERVEEWVMTDEIVGAVMLVIRHGYVVLEESVGWSDREKEISMKVDHIFRNALHDQAVCGNGYLDVAGRRSSPATG